MLILEGNCWVAMVFLKRPWRVEPAASVLYPALTLHPNLPPTPHQSACLSPLETGSFLQEARPLRGGQTVLRTGRLSGERTQGSFQSGMERHTDTHMTVVTGAVDHTHRS